jgi:hypothetical protein
MPTENLFHRIEPIIVVVKIIPVSVLLISSLTT